MNRHDSPIDFAGYNVTRSLRDFTDDELDLAVGMQPVLYSLHRAIGRPPAPVSDAAERFRLTPTEVEILTLVASGLTAVAIGHPRRVRPRTVRKHLENIYAKLGCRHRPTGTIRSPCGARTRSGNDAQLRRAAPGPHTITPTGDG